MSPGTRKFKPRCKACEQIERNLKKRDDRATAIIEARAAARARDLGVSRDFMLTNMNWRALVPDMRTALMPEARCHSCGHAFLNSRDIQIEHLLPPRFTGDWAREHARFIVLFCQSCNGTKGAKPIDEWADEQEQARLSNERCRDLFVPFTPEQPSLFPPPSRETDRDDE